VIISVAGVPLIGLSLKAALASMETMLEYGIMEDWDKQSRDSYVSQQAALSLNPGETTLFKAFGYLWNDDGLISHWVPGVWNVTNMRLILWNKARAKVIFETPLAAVHISRLTKSSGPRNEFELAADGCISRISLSEGFKFESAVLNAKANAVDVLSLGGRQKSPDARGRKEESTFA
jgi:hypothetical protein